MAEKWRTAFLKSTIMFFGLLGKIYSKQLLWSYKPITSYYHVQMLKLKL